MNNGCIVTGASSQIGDALLGLLPGGFSSVRAWSRQAQPEQPGIVWQAVDLSEVKTLDADVSHLVHLAILPLLAPLLAPDTLADLLEQAQGQAAGRYIGPAG